jgi:two-component system, cell cycle response regulator DivK
MPKKTVLIIEDHPGEWDMYGRLLWYNGFHVVVAEDGETGFRLAQERLPDLILLDLELPSLHGLEICSRLKQDDRTSGIQIVALTGRRLREFGGNAEVLGYAKFLEKPMRPLEVLRVVEELIGPAFRGESDQPAKPEVFPAVERGAAETDELAAVDESALDNPVIGQQLLAIVPRILDRWQRLGRNEPWFALPPDDRVDNLPNLTGALIRSALISPDDHAAVVMLVHESTEHGYWRRKNQIPESSIPLELHLLRQALWRQLTESFPASTQVYAAIRALDQGITVAMKASMWGYFRDEIEAQGGWESAIERLAGADRTHALE